MAVVVKKKAGVVVAKKAVAVVSKPKLELTLPTEANVPSDNLSDYSILLYGVKKGGKTSLAARFPNAFIMALEPGTKSLRVRYRDVPDWDHFVGYIDLLEKNHKGIDTVIVDTVDLAYEYIYKKTCTRLMIGSPTEENDFGATWDFIKSSFREQINRLLRMGVGVILISHDTEKEIELRDGSKIDRVQPTMSKQALSVVEALVDIIANYSFDGEDRILRLDGTQSLVAGCRLEEHFIRKGGKPNTAGDRILSIPMGRTSKEAFENFLAAFNNEQELTTAKPEEEPEAPVVVKKKLVLKQ